MASKANHMEVMHSMCQQEIELLQKNLSVFLHECARWRQIIIGGSGCQNENSSFVNGGPTDNPFALMAFDGYMSQLSAVVGLARKFNMYLQLNRLDKVLNGVSKRELPGSFKDFVQWNSILRKQGTAAFNADLASGDFMWHHDAIESASAEVLVALAAESNMKTTSSSSSTSTTLSVRKVHFASTSPEPNLAGANKSPPLTPSSPICSPSSLSRRIAAAKDLSVFCEGYEFAASITFIEDHKSLVFYVCQMNNNDLLDLSNMLHLRRYATLPPPADEIFGISINNESIMRAVMKPQMLGDSGTHRALLIDFGEVVSLGDHCELFYVPLRYQRVPAQAIKCVLLGLNDPPNAHDDDLGYLASVLERNEFKRVTFLVIRKLGAVLHVRLFENHPSEKFKTFLRSQKIAKAEVNPFLSSSDEDLTAYNVKDDDAAIPLSALSISEANNWKSKFETKFSVNAPANEFESFKETDGPSSMHIESLASASSNIEGKRTLKMQSEPTIKINSHADDESIVMVTVTHVAGVDCFYGQIENTRKDFRTPLFWNDNELPPQQKLMAPPHLNDLVLAQYIKDEFWYRAQVKEIDEEKQIFKVIFVDFGNMEIVPLSCLAKCTLTQAEEPNRAMRCRLADVIDITGNDDIRRYQALQELVVIILNQSFAVKILQRTEKELLIRIIDDEYADVPRILISKGYAKEIDYKKRT